MKKTIAILILSFYMISTTELYQLLKLPLLVEHYIVHKHQDENLTLWRFLCIHYAHGDVRDADYDQDMKLPFKTYQNYNSTNLIVSLPAKTLSLEVQPPIIQPKIFNGYHQPFTGSGHLSAIWQPPKFS